MKIYIVGGAVRDELLGLPVQDHDYVVVGATPQEMLAEGFRPVGKDFPVFLHPETQDEYALARTERKVAPGYKGFVFHADSAVTLEQDLARRDLTINAIAKGDDGTLIDPYHGQEDIRRRMFRHVSDAFVEDPVRILRVARFSARFPDFAVAPETNALMRRMVAAGEVDALVPERVWQELARGLMEKKPSRLFDVLRDCGALVRLLPELDALWEVPQPTGYHFHPPHSGNDFKNNNASAGHMQSMAVTIPSADATIGSRTGWALDYTAQSTLPLPVRFASMLLNLHFPHAGRLPERQDRQKDFQHVKMVADRLKAPTECRDLAVLAFRYCDNAHDASHMNARSVVELLAHTDAFRRPGRFDEFLHVCAVNARAFLGLEQESYWPAVFLRECLKVCQQVDTAAVSARAADKAHIPAAILAARISAITDGLGV